MSSSSDPSKYGDSLVESARTALRSDLVSRHGNLYAVRLTDEMASFLKTRATQIEQLIEAATGTNPGPIDLSDMLALLARKYKEETQYVPEP